MAQFSLHVEQHLTLVDPSGIGTGGRVSPLRQISFNFMQFLVADPGFLRGARTPEVGALTYCFTIFCQILHKNERIWPEGGHTSVATPCIHQ